MTEDTEESLIADIGRLGDTIKYCQLRIAKCALLLTVMERKRRGHYVPAEIQSKVVELFPAVRIRAKYYAVNTPINEFLEKVGKETFRTADVIRFAGDNYNPNTVSRALQMEAKNGRLIKERQGKYRAA